MTSRSVPARLAGAAGFRRLLYLRFVLAVGRRTFQAGLAGAVLFNPERGADPLTIAPGSPLLLLPYSLVGRSRGRCWTGGTGGA